MTQKMNTRVHQEEKQAYYPKSKLSKYLRRGLLALSLPGWIYFGSDVQVLYHDVVSIQEAERYVASHSQNPGDINLKVVQDLPLSLAGVTLRCDDSALILIEEESLKIPVLSHEIYHAKNHLDEVHECQSTLEETLDYISQQKNSLGERFTTNLAREFSARTYQLFN